MQNNAQQPQVIGLARLVPDSDVGLAGVGIVGRIVDSKVEMWLTFQCAQPLALSGQLEFIDVPFRKVGEAECQAIVDNFEALKEQKRAAVRSDLVLPG